MLPVLVGPRMRVDRFEIKKGHGINLMRSSCSMASACVGDARTCLVALSKPNMAASSEYCSLFVSTECACERGNRTYAR